MRLVFTTLLFVISQTEAAKDELMCPGVACLQRKAGLTQWTNAAADWNCWHWKTDTMTTPRKGEDEAEGWHSDKCFKQPSATAFGMVANIVAAAVPAVSVVPETPTEAPRELSTDMPTTEMSTGAPTEAATDSPSEAATDSPTEAATDSPTEAATDSPTEAATDSPTEAATDSPTEAATDSPTEAATDSPTEAVTSESSCDSNSGYTWCQSKSKCIRPHAEKCSEVKKSVISPALTALIAAPTPTLASPSGFWLPSYNPQPYGTYLPLASPVTYSAPSLPTYTFPSSFASALPFTGSGWAGWAPGATPQVSGPGFGSTATAPQATTQAAPQATTQAAPRVPQVPSGATVFSGSNIGR